MSFNMSSMKFTTKAYRGPKITNAAKLAPAPASALALALAPASAPAPMLFNRQVNEMQTIMNTPKTGCNSCGH